MREALLQAVWDRLRCPRCKTPISRQPALSTMTCAGCLAVYPIVTPGVPILLTPDQQGRFSRLLEADGEGRRMAAEYRSFGSWKQRLRGWLRPPSIVYDEETARKYAWIYDTRGEETLILSIGGGPGRENPRVINLNIDVFDSVDIVGDGTNLPFLDASFDTVTCNAVVEHVADPNALVSEMGRVLKPGGYAQLMIPFVFPFHAYPADYQRYSMSGIRELCRDFETTELSVLTGPTSAMLVMIREYLCILAPWGDVPSVKTLIHGISGWLTFPVKYLDVLLNRKPDAARLAAAFYYLGRKR